MKASGVSRWDAVISMRTRRTIEIGSRQARCSLSAFVLCMAVIGLTVPLLPAAAMDRSAASAPSLNSQPACQLAQSLIDEGRPGDALALIQKIRGEIPPQATTVSGACESQRLAALIKAQQQSDAAQITRAEGAGANWETFMKRWLAPLSEAGLASLGFLASFLLLARLLVFLPKMASRRYDRGERRRRLWVGIGLILIGSALIVFVAPLSASDLGLGAVSATFAGAFVGSLGAFLLAIYLSSRLRVSLEVRTPEESRNKADAARIGSYLYELGSTPPRGVEIPEGTDSTALSDGALTVGFSNKVLAAVQKLLAVVFGVTPWRVVVSFSENQSPSVAITRNGWSVAATNFDRAALGLLEGQDETDGEKAIAAVAASESGKLAASFILVTLASKHHGFEGMCGATDWRSVGLHFIATTESRPDDRTKVLLGKAVDLDAKNTLAEVAFQNHMFRQSVDDDTLEKYADWLDQKAGGLARDVREGSKSSEGYLCLLSRIRMTYLCVVLNLPQTPKYKNTRSHAVWVAQTLLQDLKPGGPVPETLAYPMRLRAALAYHDLFGTSAWPQSTTSVSDDYVPPIASWRKEALASIAPTTAYDAACSLARSGGRADQSSIRDRLSYAFTNPELKVWARTDPELHELRADKGFLEFLGLQPKQDFWDLGVFESYKDALRSAGVSSPGQLPSVAVGPDDIRLYLNVSPLVFNRLVSLAVLVWRAESVPYEDTAWRVYPFRVELVDALIQEGYESPEQIHDMWITEDAPEDPGPHNPVALIAQLRKRIANNIMIAPEAGPLKAWLRQLKATPATIPAGDHAP